MKHQFFPLKQPFLNNFAGCLLNNFTFDLTDVNIILASRRAQRRLLEILSERASAENKLLAPPCFFTPKTFCDAFTSKFVYQPVATHFEQTAAWCIAAENQKEAVESIIIKKSDFTSRDFFRVAQLLIPLHKTLSGEGLSIKHISESPFIEDYEEEKIRWNALAEIEKEYHEILNKNNLTDPYRALLEAINSASPIIQNLFAVNVVDSFKLYSRALATQCENLTIISHGEESYFDEFGLLKTENPDFEKEVINFDEKSVRFFNSPDDQAKETVKIIAENSDNFAYGDFVIAAPDKQTHRPLEQHLELVGLSAHNAAGVSFKETEPGSLFSALAESFDTAGFEAESFFALIKHPLIENYLTREVCAGDVQKFDGKISKINKKVCENKIEIINSNSLKFFADDEKLIIETVLKNIIEPLSLPLSINETPEKINSMLEKLYSEKQEDIDSNVHQDALENWLRLSDEIANSRIKWEEKCDARTTFLRFMLLLKNISLIPKAQGPVIDITGWLEIALDDAPVIIVVGFNEGLVPEKISADAFLPNSLREKLKLPNYKSRFLRDKYLTKCLVEKPGKCFFLAARRSAENEPLKPSSLLFCQEFETQAKFLKDFYDAEEIEGHTAGQSTNFVDCNRQKMSIELPAGKKLDLDFLNTLSVSKINNYLACPFKFFLKNVWKIKTPDEFSAELEAFEIGNLFHFVINQNLDLLHSETDKEMVGEKLVSDMEIFLREKYGENLSPAILIQKENIIRRLKNFVPVFRKTFDGWIVALDDEDCPLAEYEIFPEIETDAGKVKINGKVDLVERKNDFFRIIDFKTGGAKKKNDIFAARKQEWKDMQLILYALWAEQQFKIFPELGFFNIPADADKIKYEEIVFEDEEIASAREKIKEILSIIIDDKIPLEEKFCRTENSNSCRFCEFKQICER